MACHVLTVDAAGQTQYGWGATDPANNQGWLDDEGWSHSARCLSCHDGNLAQVMDMGNIGGRPTVNGPHPVNMRYQTQGGEYFPIKLTGSDWLLVNNPENPNTQLKLFRRSAFDPTPTVQCASCHDPHNASNPFFLRDPYDRLYTGTKFCRTCHAEHSNYAVAR